MSVAKLKIPLVAPDYYVVVQLPNPNKLGWEGRWFVKWVLLPLLRLADREYGYSVTGEIQSVKTDREQAESAVVEMRKGVAYPVPVDSDLPQETIRYGKPIYSEDLKRRYARPPPCQYVSVKRCELEKLSSAADSVLDTISQIEVRGR